MYYQDIAIILNRRDFREDDVLIDCLTQKHGKIVLLVKAGKKIKSKLNSHVDMFNLVNLNWVSGKGIDRLIGASSQQAWQKIKKDYYKINHGLYFLNILNQAIHLYAVDERIFNFIKNVLIKLENCEEQDLALVKLSFDYKLLFLLGYNPAHRKELQKDEKEIIDKIIKFSVEEIKKNNFSRQILNKVYNKSKILWEEVLDREVRNIKIH